MIVRGCTGNINRTLDMSEVKEKPKRDRKEYMKKYHKERYEEFGNDRKFNQALEYWLIRNAKPGPRSKLINMCKERNISVEAALEQRRQEIGSK